MILSSSTLQTGVYNLYQVMSRVRNIASREFSYYLFPFTSVWYFTGNKIRAIGYSIYENDTKLSDVEVKIIRWESFKQVL